MKLLNKWFIWNCLPKFCRNRKLAETRYLIHIWIDVIWLSLKVLHLWPVTGVETWGQASWMETGIRWKKIWLPYKRAWLKKDRVYKDSGQGHASVSTALDVKKKKEIRLKSWFRKNKWGLNRKHPAVWLSSRENHLSSNMKFIVLGLFSLSLLGLVCAQVI